MVISEQQVNSEVIIEKMVGRFDQNACQEYKWRMDLAINAGYRHIILDFTDVTFIDSAATIAAWLLVRCLRFKFNEMTKAVSDPSPSHTLHIGERPLLIEDSGGLLKQLCFPL